MGDAKTRQITHLKVDCLISRHSSFPFYGAVRDSVFAERFWRYTPFFFTRISSLCPDVNESFLDFNPGFNVVSVINICFLDYCLLPYEAVKWIKADKIFLAVRCCLKF